RLEAAALEIRARVQGDDLGPVGFADLVVAEAEHVVPDSCTDQGDVWFHELPDTRRGVQAIAVRTRRMLSSGTPWPCRKRRASSALSTLKRRPLSRNSSLRPRSWNIAPI